MAIIFIEKEFKLGSVGAVEQGMKKLNPRAKVMEKIFCFRYGFRIVIMYSKTCQLRPPLLINLKPLCI
jgi:hypothetical protein